MEEKNSAKDLKSLCNYKNTAEEEKGSLGSFDNLGQNVEMA